MDKKNFTRESLCNKIYQNIGFSKNFSSNIIDQVFNLLSSELIETKKIKITSFGTLEIINKKERIGRNPKTKVKAKITARKIVKFKPSEILKKRIND
tara:strand:+ start:172 stop:462 length:291 start_codon:yes stop_codon:yes gene_type:complete